jgi:hypothetical protein
VVLFSTHDVLPKLAALPMHDDHDGTTKEPHATADAPSYAGSFRLLVAVTVSSSAVLAVYSVPTTTALGTSSAIFAAIGLVLFERAVRGIEDEDLSATHGSMPATGAQLGWTAAGEPPKEQQLAALRDIATALATICGLISVLMEPSITSAVSRGPSTNKYDQGGTKVNDVMTMQRIFWMLPVNVLANALMYIIVSTISLHPSTILKS